MDPAFWLERWREGKIGFHEGRPNAFLVRHEARLGAGTRVLVPLCGKAEDLAFLAGRGHEVVGIELVEAAARAFFAEHGLEPAVERRGRFTVCSAGGVTILVGDLFDADRTAVGEVGAFYDRAALIALPEADRARYVARLRELVPAGASGLVVTLEYPQDLMAGPPFSVPEPELRRHYAGAEVALLEEAAATGGRMGEAGIPATERCFLVT